jgi:hypothetical protein
VIALLHTSDSVGEVANDTRHCKKHSRARKCSAGPTDTQCCCRAVASRRSFTAAAALLLAGLSTSPGAVQQDSRGAVNMRCCSQHAVNMRC